MSVTLFSTNKDIVKNLQTSDVGTLCPEWLVEGMPPPMTSQRPVVVCNRRATPSHSQLGSLWKKVLVHTLAKTLVHFSQYCKLLGLIIPFCGENTT